MQEQDDFIMLPTNDVCFAGLMENSIVRKGFCASVMRIQPEEVEETELLPTHMRRKYAGDKLGILDVLVRLKDGSQINMEMQVKYFEFWDERALFYLSKMFAGQLKQGDSYEKLQRCIHVSILDFIRFPEDEVCYRTINFRDNVTNKVYNHKMELQILELRKVKYLSGAKGVSHPQEEIVQWMRFFSGKSREEFRCMARKNQYLGEAYEALQRLSADDKKRLEYEAREKALKDYNTQMSSARRQGEEVGERRGLEIGVENGIQLACKVIRLHAKGMPDEEIASECNISVEKVQKIVVL